MSRARRLLGSRQFPPAMIALALLLVSPSLFVGLHFDDYLQRTLLLDRSASISTATAELFVFMDGDRASSAAKIDSGVYPWFADPSARVAFWRPLSALTHWLDYRLWPASALLMHVQNLVWFALLAWVVVGCYRRMMEIQEWSSVWQARQLAGLAACLYVFDDARGFAVGWLANRNALLAALLGLSALWAHDRWRRGAWRRGRVLSPCLFALALLAGESGIATLAYLIAYEVCLTDRPVWCRLRSLLPSCGVTVCWRLLYSMGGFGSSGTSYVDPAGDPVSFAQSVVERAPILLLGQWLLPPAELVNLLAPVGATVVWVSALVIGALLAWWLSSVLRESALGRFFGLGMVLASIPACAALPANRLLFFVGFGAFGLLAVLTERLVRLDRHPLFHGLLGFHLLQAPLLAVTAISPALLGSIEPELATLPKDRDFSRQTAVFVNPLTHFHVSYLTEIRNADEMPLPTRLRYLASGLTSVEYRRVDPKTIEVWPEAGFVLGFETVFRGSGTSFEVGDTVVLSDVEIEILALTTDRRPAAAAFRFRVPLEDESLRWLWWDGDRYAPFPLPAIGEIERLDPSSVLW